MREYDGGFSSGGVRRGTGVRDDAYANIGRVYPGPTTLNIDCRRENALQRGDYITRKSVYSELNLLFGNNHFIQPLSSFINLIPLFMNETRV